MCGYLILLSNGINSPATGITLVADSQNAAGNIIQILANLPDFLRKPLLHSRLKEFFSMSEGEKREMIGLALAAAPSIAPDKLAALVGTWLEVLCDFEPEKRNTLFAMYSQQIMATPKSLERIDFATLTRTFMSLGETQRETIIDSLHEVLFAIPNRNKLLELIPEDAQRSLKLAH